MPNGSSVEWSPDHERKDQYLQLIDDILTRFAEGRKLGLEKNYHGSASRMVCAPDLEKKMGNVSVKVHNVGEEMNGYDIIGLVSVSESLVDVVCQYYSNDRNDLEAKFTDAYEAVLVAMQTARK